jgi:predicted metalloprotease with PDZ domain
MLPTTIDRRLFHVLLAALAVGLPAQQPPAPSAAKALPPVRYRFVFEHGKPGPEITMRIEGVTEPELRVAMPVWKPGHYVVENYSRRVAELTAVGSDGKSNGKALEVTKPDQHSWAIATAGSSCVEVRYELRAPRAGGLGAATRDENDARVYKAYQYEGPETWLYARDRLRAPQEVTFGLPEGWKIATGMLPGSAPNQFHCADYDTFADCPFRIGDFEERTFTVEGVPHRIVWSGFERDTNDRDEVARRYERIVKAQVAMMGKPPYPFYVFLISAPGGAGLEHLNSTNSSMNSLEGSNEDTNSVWDSLISHEFFHLWNVKRLRPKALGPFDYSGPNRTGYLWLSEGCTSYYGDLLLVRAGVWREDLYWTRTIANEINVLQRDPSRLRMSVAEASRTVWDRRAFSRMQAPDYYNKGQLLGLLLDIEIRDATDGAKSFDDVMRSLYEQCLREGKGFEDGDVQKTCERVAGRSFAAFFRDYVDGVVELPFEGCLAKIGLQLVPRGPASQPASQPASSGPASSAPASARGYSIRIDRAAPERAQRLRAQMMRPTEPR